jgi:hypothetical protein
MMKKLNEIPGKNPFKVPENYFEDVNRKIISATSGYDMDVKKRVQVKRLRPYLAVAASVAAFILLSYTALKLLTPDSINLQVSEVINGNYSTPYENDIDIFTLEENVASLLPEDEGLFANETDIIDYLILENIDISDIYEQL